MEQSSNANKLQKNNAVVFGETNLCIICIEYLLSRDWGILNVVSQDRVVHSWCNKNQIKCIPINDINLIFHEGFYVFSIINPYIVSSKFIKEKQVKLAINYHDSLLPQYSGVNSTTWAILDGAVQHGVSWHVIAEKIDGGDILAQRAISIGESDTVHSLNVSCTELAYELFVEVVTRINEDKLSLMKQDCKNRSYYGRQYLPKNYGFIGKATTEAEFHRMHRALDFGEGYENQVATVKVELDNRIYVLKKEVGTGKQKASELVRLYGEQYKFLDMYGLNNLKLADKIIYSMAVPNEKDLNVLSSIKTYELQNKTDLIDKLQQYEIELADRSLAVRVELVNSRMITFNSLLDFVVVLNSVTFHANLL